MSTLSRLVAAAVLSVVLGFIATFAAVAQTQDAAPAEVTLPDPLTQPQIDGLVSRLSDKEVRDLLLQELGNRAETPPESVPRPAALVDHIAFNLRLIIARVETAVTTSPDNLAAILAAIGKYLEILGPSGAVQLGGILLAAILAGLAVDLLFSAWVLKAGARHLVPVSQAPVFPGSLPLLARRLLKDAGGALLALIAGAVILALLLPEREVRVGMTVVLWLFFFPRLAWAVLRFFLSPDLPALRLVDTDDWTARTLVYNLVGVLLVFGLIQTMLAVMQEVGMAYSTIGLGFWINLLVFFWLGVTVIRCRAGLKQIVAGGQVPLMPQEQWVVSAYPAYALVMIVLTLLFGLISAALGNREVMREGWHLVSLGLLLVAPMCDSLIRATVRLVVPPMQGTGAAAQAAFDASWRSHIRVARMIVFGAIIFVLMQLWGLSLLNIAKAGVGDYLGDRLVAAIAILAVGYLLMEVVSLAMNRKLANLQPDTFAGQPLQYHTGNPANLGAVSRLGTILPPISWMLQAAIVVITVLTALAQLGVNVMALVAGAGVAGIAIGFGAQKLVADLVSGVFFLMDDAFRVNEYISTGKIEGHVEKIGLQSMHLRQSDGALHCVPYSSVDTVGNFSRNWGTDTLDFTVPFDTDIDRVRAIFNQIGEELAENPAYKGIFLQPFAFKGLVQLNDVGAVVRGKFMFRPEFRRQFAIRREIYRKVHDAFTKAGIPFARREVRLSMDARDGILTEPAKEGMAGNMGRDKDAKA